MLLFFIRNLIERFETVITSYMFDLKVMVCFSNANIEPSKFCFIEGERCAQVIEVADSEVGGREDMLMYSTCKYPMFSVKI